MQKASLLLMTLVAALFAQAQKNEPSLSQLQWLAGEWQRTNAKPGHSDVETWQIVSPTRMEGTAVTFKGKDTAFVEKAAIVVRNDSIFYVADVPGNTQPVSFWFTALTDSGFVCENPAHDFPTKIAYAKSGAGLKATISGRGKVIDYLFVRKN